MKIEIESDSDFEAIVSVTKLRLETSSVYHYGARYSAMDRMGEAFAQDPFLRAAKEAMIDYLADNNTTMLDSRRWIDEKCEQLAAEFDFNMEECN